MTVAFVENGAVVGGPHTNPAPVSFTLPVTMTLGQSADLELTYVRVALTELRELLTTPVVYSEPELQSLGCEPA